MTTHIDNLTLGRGELWFAPFLPGTTTLPAGGGYRFLGNVPEFNVNVTAENLDHYGSTRGVRELDRSIPVSTNRSATISCEDIDQENLALFFLGDAGIVAQTSATTLTETFADVVVGRRYFVGVTASNPTGYRSLTTPVLKKGVATLVAGTDYSIDAERGFIDILGGGVADGDDVTLEFGRAAVSRTQVITGSMAAEGAFKYIAYPAEGKPIDFFMPRVKISPNGDFSLIAESALQAIPLSVNIQTLGALKAIYADGLPYTA